MYIYAHIYGVGVELFMQLFCESEMSSFTPDKPCTVNHTVSLPLGEGPWNVVFHEAGVQGFLMSSSGHWTHRQITLLWEGSSETT